MTKITPLFAKQIMHDYAREDRRQLLLHTKITPLISEAMEEVREERAAMEMLVWAFFVGFCGALVAVVILLAELGVID